ncbi:CAP domain-containing protein [Nodularia sphaerocarpa]|uniref:CAP domain-containing protein n=1 Tax=Nodularia sphaerocarpa TaxID=137816 RepID=UPI001EFABA4A|nr:CAP domain-containing protein [Nodularia sphaerocarpa]MDB9372490.1 CAP domain-containing protein [Nodularia sphaerocarpa CS-585]MDB9377368.1 CAP domain-containing protein [Nodularia sphaerocarpa CS-585A2]ULP70463.1 hypothetical protein BDGGKGIB_00079 [Nodularia sphaerocarpa UHCC 0038]
MSVEIFTDSNFSGSKSGSIDYNSSYIGDFWNDKISSIKVYSGTWDFFEHANFQGRSFRLGRGEYPSFNNEMNDTISSFKKVAEDGSPAPSDNGVLKRILDLTNMERGKVSLPPLTFNSKLAAAAQKHSQSMAMQDFFDHRQMVERVTAEGYQYSRVGENISAGNSTPEAAMQSWMNSSGHRANILNPQFRELGVGYYFLENDQGSVNYKHYWTQVFGIPQ